MRNPKDYEIPIDLEGRGTPTSLIDSKSRRFPLIKTPNKKISLPAGLYRNKVWSPTPNTSTLVVTIPRAKRHNIRKNDIFEIKYISEIQITIRIIRIGVKNEI